jgi:hypothetical protein
MGNEYDTQEVTKSVRQRIESGNISKLVSYAELTSGNPSKERVLGRLEAYVQTGVVIDQDDLMAVAEEYKFSRDDYKHLAPLANTGVIEGLVQEPDNIPNYGSRIGCFTSLCLEATEEN